MAILIAHLSDAHLKSPNDTLMRRGPVLARAIAGEVDGSVKACLIAFTGDATDKGNVAGFGVARQFFDYLLGEVGRLTGLDTELLLIPGNHDVVVPPDPSLRDIAIASLSAAPSAARPRAAVEREILAPLTHYFDFAAGLKKAVSPTADRPYYVYCDRVLDGRAVRFHLLNSSWMCKVGQGPGSLLYPIAEITPAPADGPLDYEISLLHHPFAWFKQPETMRPLRDAVEGMSDLILTGHEHVGRTLTEDIHGHAAFEYREGDALQEGDKGQDSGFHLLRLDFDSGTQVVTSYRWQAADGYVRTAGPSEAALGRNRRRARPGQRLRAAFEEKVDDPELPVSHAKLGTLRLSDFYTYPDLKQVADGEDDGNKRLSGDAILAMVKANPRTLVLGPDRCGKSCLAKRLFADLHKQGDVPLLADGRHFKNWSAERLSAMLEAKVGEQYESLPPETFWQLDRGRVVLILDDLHHGPSDRQRREELIADLQKKFERIVIIGSDEFYYEEMVPTEVAGRRESALWSYKHFRILPFGFIRREQFVRRWVSLDRSQSPGDTEDKVSQLNTLLTHFLRNNPIPQSPWVIMIIVQAADSPEPLHAVNGSYGYLLQALITAALARSRLKHPIPGKYRWLAELADALHRGDDGDLSDAQARAVHEAYRLDYGAHGLDYKEFRDDMVAAGVLRLEGDRVSFRQPYTYCYFVAWRLAQRIHEGDESARGDVKRLWDDLYHEDTANVLVFLAHLTNSNVALEEMTASAGRLFADSRETDLATDVGPINALCRNVGELVIPPGDPASRRHALKNAEDDRRAERDSKRPPRREITLRPATDGRVGRDEKERRVIEIVTALRAIEILGQVLRNEATARKVESLAEITDEVFRLGRRLLGFLFSSATNHLDQMVSALEGHYRLRMPNAEDAEITTEANAHVFNLYLLGAFAVVKCVAVAVGDRHLRAVFRRLVEDDPSVANRIYTLAVNLEITTGHPPLREAEELSDELLGKSKGRGQKRAYNNFAHTLLRALVADYLYLNHVPRPQIQALCQKLRIELPAGASDPAPKRLPSSRK